MSKTKNKRKYCQTAKQMLKNENSCQKRSNHFMENILNMNYERKYFEKIKTKSNY